MARNSLGEIETAPGAQRREAAHWQREAASLAQKEAQFLSEVGETHLDLATAYRQRARLSLEVVSRGGGDMLRCTPRTYLENSNAALERASVSFAEAAMANKRACEQSKKAFINNVISVAQTLKARILGR